MSAYIANFNPLPPHGGRPRHQRKSRHPAIFQSTPSAWRETYYLVSILMRWLISIHSLRMEGDYIPDSRRFPGGKFQSTPSAWRETGIRCLLTLPGKYFNPLPPHGGRLIIMSYWDNTKNFNPLPPHGGRRCTGTIHRQNVISIHSLRMEGDMLHGLLLGDGGGFQSTPSAWRETSYKPDASADTPFQSTPSAWRETHDLQ